MKHETRGEETKAVKEALKKAGINARVGHGKGTAWGWLHINIGAGQDFGEHDKCDQQHGCRSDCPRCVGVRSMMSHAIRIAKEITGRSGEYDGRINIYTQDHWTDAKGSQPIRQPNWKKYTESGDPPKESKPIKLVYLNLDQQQTVESLLVGKRAGIILIDKMKLKRKPGQTPLSAWLDHLCEINGLPFTEPIARKLKDAILSDQGAVRFLWAIA